MYIYRFPSIPYGDLSTIPGYSFENEESTRASYFVAMEHLGLIREQGCDLSKERWMDSCFILPFKISPDFSSYDAKTSEKILQEPVIQHGKYKLFLEYKNTTTYIIRY